MMAESLLVFLKEEQKELITIEQCRDIVKKFETSADKSSFTREGFTHFLIFNDWQVWLTQAVPGTLYTKYNSSPGADVTHF